MSTATQLSRRISDALTDAEAKSRLARVRWLTDPTAARRLIFEAERHLERAAALLNERERDRLVVR